jgi:hypothetical protein
VTTRPVSEVKLYVTTAFFLYASIMSDLLFFVFTTTQKVKTHDDDSLSLIPPAVGFSDR